MRQDSQPGVSSAPRSRGFFAVGMILAVLLLVGVGETFLRYFPPTDNREYLGEASPLVGPYMPDGTLGVAYRSWEAFRDDNAERLAPYLPLDKSDGRPTWAMFGSSFVHMQGMLADTVRQELPRVRVFNLGRSEALVVRIAQARLLLEHGFRPERIFLALMPLDMAILGQQPLDTIRVTSKGAITYAPRLPPAPFGNLIQKSALVRTAWFRTQQHQGNPRFRYLQLHREMPKGLRNDASRLFGELARIGQEYAVPVTLLLIPTHEQIAKGAAFAFQDDLGPLCRDLGLDVCDPRSAFLGYPNKADLFIPDKHFAPPGNQILLRELQKHLHQEVVQGGGPS